MKRKKKMMIMQFKLNIKMKKNIFKFIFFILIKFLIDLYFIFNY